MAGEARGDKPRRIVVCNPSEYAEMQRGVTELGYGDVLVQPNPYIEAGHAYVIDAEALDGPFTVSSWEA